MEGLTVIPNGSFLLAWSDGRRVASRPGSGCSYAWIHTVRLSPTSNPNASPFFVIASTSPLSPSRTQP
jgi:hypothetical protein